MRVWTRRVISASLLIILLAMGTPYSAHAASLASAPKPVPTAACGSSLASAASGTAAQFRGHQEPPPSATAYDEQIGITFTQSFSSLEYNVTAVAQTDPVLDDGPCYLLNGLANTGYWYQVGLSWNWSPGQTPGTGFDMNYEVFDTSQNSIFPTDGGGGVAAFSGSVNPGDTVLLNLYFSSSSVVMAAEDISTGSFASETYGAQGGTCFVGSPSGPANSNGYFTGLMTEWYHGDPYFANGEQVTYSDSAFGLSSAWMWMDEFNSNTLQALFSSQTSSPVAYTSPGKLQEFSYNGTDEFSDAYEFVTGNLTSTTTPTTFPLTFSYSVSGGSSGSVPPTLTYVSDGVPLTATLNATAVTYNLDQGSTWSVSQVLGGSSNTERWETVQATTGIANSAQTIALVYYHQFWVIFVFSVLGGGSGYSAPSVTYQSFGSSETLVASPTPIPQGVWVDAGSRYSYGDPLPGSSSSERWSSDGASGTVSGAGALTATYVLQYSVVVEASFTGSGIFPSVGLRSTSYGLPFLGTVVQGTSSFWLDANASYSMPQTISLSQGERWATNGTTTGRVSGPLSIALDYQYEYYVSIGVNSPDGGTVSEASGWYLPGTSLQLTETTSPGWQFEGWSGFGRPGSAGGLDLVLGGPFNFTALFYPGITMSAEGPVSIAYQDGSTSGTVSAGTRTVVHVPPNSTLSLTASPAPFLYSFTGWSGATTSSSPGVSFSVNGPEAVTAKSSYSYTDIAIILAVAILIILGVILALRTTKKTATGI
jgi:hypothetical protein